jgi:hypothetical protein
MISLAPGAKEKRFSKPFRRLPARRSGQSASLGSAKAVKRAVKRLFHGFDLHIVAQHALPNGTPAYNISSNVQRAIVHFRLPGLKHRLFSLLRRQ